MDPNRQLNDTVVRQPRASELLPILMVNEVPRKSRWFVNHYVLFFSCFTFLAFIGGSLLTLPVSSNSGTITNFDVALFTATSAITITGLAVVSTSSYWSPFGQAIIFSLMLLGGLSLISVTSFLLLSIGHNFHLFQRATPTRSLGSNNTTKLAYLTRNIAMTLCVLYFLGAAAIFWNMHLADTSEIKTSLWQSIFLSVSAFNNSGFSILPGIGNNEVLNSIPSDKFLIGTLTILMIIGGLGWPVLVDFYHQRKFNRLSLNTKLVLTTSLFLWLIGTGIFLLAEYGNTLAGLNFLDKLWYSIFHSISGRTAGFHIVNFQSVQDFTKLTYPALMFIGGGSASMAGGIKINAFAVIIVAVISSLKGRVRPEAFGREVSRDQVSLALTVGFLGIAFVIGVMPILNLTEPDVHFLDLLFETVSAFSTNGTSVGVASGLSIVGKSIFILAMLIGRLGPIALALILIPRDNSVYHFMEERVTIG